MLERLTQLPQRSSPQRHTQTHTHTHTLSHIYVDRHRQQTPFFLFFFSNMSSMQTYRRTRTSPQKSPADKGWSCMSPAADTLPMTLTSVSSCGGSSASLPCGGSVTYTLHTRAVCQAPANHWVDGCFVLSHIWWSSWCHQNKWWGWEWWKSWLLFILRMLQKGYN